MVGIGIDLGTSNSLVAIYLEDDAVVVTNDIGDRSTPSVVAVQERKQLVGKEAVLQAAMNPTNTIRNVKRVLGETYSCCCEDKPSLLGAVRISKDKERDAVTFRVHHEEFAPEEVTAVILRTLLDAAQQQLQCDAEEVPVVIGVPSYFTTTQRMAVGQAGKIAGLKKCKLINETSAAALVYAAAGDKGGRTAVVVDVGGGGSSISVVDVKDSGSIWVRASSGVRLPGGNDMDSLMIAYFAEIIRRDHQKDVFSDDRALEILRRSWQGAKATLSLVPLTKIEVYLSGIDVDFRCVVEAAEFRNVCWDHFKETFTDAVDTVLQHAQTSKDAIGDVVLVGGASRTPWLRDLLQEVLGCRSFCRSVNADEAVARGAALHAVSPIKLPREVSAHSMSVFVGKEKLQQVPENYVVPFQLRLNMVAPFTVKEGVKQHLCFSVLKSKEVPKSSQRILGYIGRNSSGELFLKRDGGIPVKLHYPILSPNRVEQLRRRAEERINDEKCNMKRIETKNTLENVCRELTHKIFQDGAQSKEKKAFMLSMVDDVLLWLRENGDAPLEEYESRLQTLEPLFSELLRASAADREPHPSAGRGQGGAEPPQDEAAGPSSVAPVAPPEWMAVDTDTDLAEDVPDSATTSSPHRCRHEPRPSRLQTDPPRLPTQAKLLASLDQMSLKKKSPIARPPAPRIPSTVVRPPPPPVATPSERGELVSGDGPASSGRDGDEALVEVFRCLHLHVVESALSRGQDPGPLCLPPRVVELLVNKGCHASLVKHELRALRSLALAVKRAVAKEVRSAGRAALLVDTVVAQPGAPLTSVLLRYCLSDGAIVERLIALLPSAEASAERLLGAVEALCEEVHLDWREVLTSVSMDAAPRMERQYGRLLALIRERCGRGRLRPVWNNAHRLPDVIAQACCRIQDVAFFFSTIETVRELFRSGEYLAQLARHCDLDVSDLSNHLQTLDGVVRLLSHEEFRGKFVNMLVRQSSRDDYDYRTLFQVTSLIDALGSVDFLSWCIFFSNIFDVTEHLSVRLSEAGCEETLLKNVLGKLEQLGTSDYYHKLTKKLSKMGISGGYSFQSFKTVLTIAIESFKSPVEEAVKSACEVKKMVHSARTSTVASDGTVFTSKAAAQLATVCRSTRYKSLPVSEFLSQLMSLYERGIYRKSYGDLFSCLQELCTLPLISAGGGTSKIDTLRNSLRGRQCSDPAVLEPSMILVCAYDGLPANARLLGLKDVYQEAVTIFQSSVRSSGSTD